MDNFSHLYDLGLSFLKNKDYEIAKNVFREILIKNNHAQKACFYLALINSILGNLDESIAGYEKYLSFNPHDITALNNLGFAYQEKGDDEAALDTWNKALIYEPNDFQVLTNVGLFYKKFGPLTKAVDIFNKILTIAPLDFNSLVNKGNTLMQMGLYCDAITSFNSAYTVNPFHSTLLNSLSKAYIEVEQPSVSLKYSKLAVEKFPKNSNCHNILGLVYKKLNNYKEATSCFNNAVLLDPHSAHAQSNFIRSLYQNKQFEIAIKTSEKQLEFFLKSQHLNIHSDSINIPVSKLLHDIEQAKFLIKSGYEVNGINEFLEVGESIATMANETTQIDNFKITRNEYITMIPYLTDGLVYRAPNKIAHCLNPEIDWQKIEKSYLSNEWQVTSIDNFLTMEALDFFRKFCKLSKVWTTNYFNNYLGAFVQQGFISLPHLQLANELKVAMPKIFKDYELEQLWGFKYEPRMSRGIGIHADSAMVNLNFWITPDSFNLNQNSGGMLIYKKPAPKNWTFQEYNTNSELIYNFLGGENAEHINIAHRSNRAALFNSALFHETDSLSFNEGYESRRINMTYLFGSQLN